MKVLVGVLGLAVASLATPANAQSRTPDARPEAPRPSFTDHPFVIGARGGYGTSVGLAGVIAEVNVLEAVALGGGIGWNGPGVEYGAHLRVRPMTWKAPRRTHAISLEGAFTRAPYFALVGEIGLPGLCHGSDEKPDDECYVASRAPETVSWVGADLGWEILWPSGLSLRIAVGAAWLLSPDPGCGFHGEPRPCKTDTHAEGWVTSTSFTLARGF